VNKQSATICAECAEALNGYEIEDGIIRSPGKFEGEPVYVVHYWHLAMDGFAYDCDARECNGWVFPVTTEDVAMFPELELGCIIHIGESGNGFVYCEVVSENELDDHIEANESEFGEEEN